MKDSIWSTPSICSVEYKAKPKGRGRTLEETRPDHAIRISVAITKSTVRLCHPEEEEEQQQKKGEMRFFENNFSLDFLTFWPSYSIYSIITGSGTQQVSFME